MSLRSCQLPIFFSAVVLFSCSLLPCIRNFGVPCSVILPAYIELQCFSEWKATSLNNQEREVVSLSLKQRRSKTHQFTSFLLSYSKVTWRGTLKSGPRTIFAFHFPYHLQSAFANLDFLSYSTTLILKEWTMALECVVCNKADIQPQKCGRCRVRIYCGMIWAILYEWI